MNVVRLLFAITHGVLVSLILIVGLLNFPTTCECGAELPHVHSLFLVAGHDHHEHDHDHASNARDQSHAADATAAQPDDHPTATSLLGGSSEGSALRLPADATSNGNQLLAILALALTVAIAGATVVHWLTSSRPGGYVVAPEPPPPRWQPYFTS